MYIFHHLNIYLVSHFLMTMSNEGLRKGDFYRIKLVTTLLLFFSKYTMCRGCSVQLTLHWPLQPWLTAGQLHWSLRQPGLPAPGPGVSLRQTLGQVTSPGLGPSYVTIRSTGRHAEIMTRRTGEAAGADWARNSLGQYSICRNMLDLTSMILFK